MTATNTENEPVAHSLWHNSEFLKFWTGETLSLFGNHVTM
jgi:hypothetical protein